MPTSYLLHYMYQSLVLKRSETGHHRDREQHHLGHGSDQRSCHESPDHQIDHHQHLRGHVRERDLDRRSCYRR